jgi:DNA-directed RNA polymerase subunit RPC12/RpoP
VGFEIKIDLAIVVATVPLRAPADVTLRCGAEIVKMPGATRIENAIVEGRTFVGTKKHGQEKSMDKLKPKQALANVTLTLDPLDAALTEILGNEFPCPVCGAALAIRSSKNKKPYCICNDCGIQLFVRGKVGITRLHKLVREGILVSSSGESAGHAIPLLNRLEQLEMQKRKLKVKSALIFFTDPDLENAIEIIDAEIKTVQGELAHIASAKRKEAEK